MGRMIMGDFPCIYEAMMMIKYNEEYKKPRPELHNEWIGYVLSNFMLESSEM
jgi:hypothetical protein